jgi:hypothetical protein
VIPLFFSATFSRRLLSVVAGLAVLGGCSTGMNAMVDSVRQVLPRGQTADGAALDARFAYIRITRGGHVGLLWRGSTEPGPEGTVEVYYSGSGEVVRLLDGRLAGALGLNTEWRKVSLTAPSWRTASAVAQGVSFVRVRDVMPGYRSGVRDEVTVRPIAAPSRTALRAVDPGTLAWFEERTTTSAGDAPVPVARYGVDLAGAQEQVIYAEQCVAVDLCFTWQRWSAAMQQAAVNRR